MSILRPATVLLALFTLLTGVLYPALVTGIAQAAMPRQAAGSVLRDARGAYGSELIGQSFVDPRYFWGRPSSTSPVPYDASASTGSNLGPNNPKLRELVIARVAALRAADPRAPARVPVDLVTASGSGLDPHVSPAGALFQVGRVARARHLEEARVRTLVDAHVEGRTWTVLGEPRVDVVQLNHDLDELTP